MGIAGALEKIGAAFLRAGKNPKSYIYAAPPRAGGLPEDTVAQVYDKFGISNAGAVRPGSRLDVFDAKKMLRTRADEPVYVDYALMPENRDVFLTDTVSGPNKMVSEKRPIAAATIGKPMTVIDSSAMTRGSGGSEVYQGLFSALNLENAVNMTGGLTQVNRFRKPSNMLSFLARHPESHNRVILPSEAGFIDPRQSGIKNWMSPAEFIALSPEEKAGWLALREMNMFRAAPDYGGAATNARAGEHGVTDYLLKNVVEGTPDIEGYVDDMINRGMWDKVLYREGGLVR